MLVILNLEANISLYWILFDVYILSLFVFFYHKTHYIWIFVYKLLIYLATSEGKMCSRGELLEHVWELPPTLNTRTVDTHVKRLRQKLGSAAGLVQTVRGAGYRFSDEAQ